MSAVVDPTAASAWLPLNRPTTMISTALNISCKIPDTISGSEKEISLSIIVPLHMSISYLFFFKNTPPSSVEVVDVEKDAVIASYPVSFFPVG